MGYNDFSLTRILQRIRYTVRSLHLRDARHVKYIIRVYDVYDLDTFSTALTFETRRFRRFYSLTH